MNKQTVSDLGPTPGQQGAGIYPRLINLGGVTLPVAGLVVGLWLLWGTHFNWLYLGLLVGMYLLTGFGITIGYHRLFTHRSFKTPRWCAATLAVLGSMAVEGSVLHWVAVHRKHHQHSDDHGDPHSPHAHGDGLIGTLRGMWHAHIGWSLGKKKSENLAHYVYDLRKDKSLVWISRLFPVLVLISFIVPAALGGLLTMSWMGVLLGFCGAGWSACCWSTTRPGVSTRSATSGAVGRTRATTRAETTRSSASSRSARAGITTTTPSRPRRGTAWRGGKST